MKESARGLDALLAREELPTAPADVVAKLRALGFIIGEPHGPTMPAVMPRDWWFMLLPWAPMMGWLLDERRHRRVALSWNESVPFLSIQSRGQTLVMDDDGLACMARQSQMSEIALVCDECTMVTSMSWDPSSVDTSDVSTLSGAFARMERTVREHRRFCQELRFALMPSAQRAGAPPVLEVVSARGRCFAPAPPFDHLRLERLRLPVWEDPSVPSKAERWRAFPPSRRRRMRSWQTAAAARKAHYEPLRGYHARAKPGAPCWPVWARDPRVGWRAAPQIKLDEHRIEVSAMGHWNPAVYMRGPAPSGLVAELARVIGQAVCGARIGHAWHPVAPMAVSWPPSGPATVCGRCGAAGEFDMQATLADATDVPDGLSLAEIATFVRPRFRAADAVVRQLEANLARRR